MVGYLLLDFSYLIFVIYLAGQQKWVTKFRLLVHFIAPAVIIGLMLAGWETLPEALAKPNSAFGVQTFLPSGGIIGRELLFILYSNLVGFLSLYWLISMYQSVSPYYRRSVMALVLGTAMIATVGLLEILSANPFPRISILQTVMAFIAIPVILIVFTWKDIHNIPINLQLFKETMRDGYLIVDSQCNVIDFNPPIQALLATGGLLKTGCSIVDCLPELHTAVVQGIVSGAESTQSYIDERRD